MKTRGFEIVRGYENENIRLPKRQTLKSAGYDLESCEHVEIESQQMRLVKTGLKAYMLDDEVLKIYIRSSMAVKKGAMLSNHVGIIDADYYNNLSNDGHILIPIYNNSQNLLIIDKGEKIAQGIFQKFLITDDDQPTQSIRSGGFGSSSN